jgi:hypothetical protein
MCTPEYDLVCDECRKKFDRIFSIEIKSAEQERKLLMKWLKSLKNLFILESLLSDDFREILLERLDKIDLPASMKDLLAFLKEF